MNANKSRLIHSPRQSPTSTKQLRAKVQAAGDKVPPEGSEKYNRGWAAAALLKDRQTEKLEVTDYLLRDWCWYYRKALVAQEQPDAGNPRPFAKWIETAATNADVRALCQAFLAEARVSQGYAEGLGVSASFGCYYIGVSISPSIHPKTTTMQ